MGENGDAADLARPSGTNPAELDVHFERWADKLRGRVKRMRRKLGSERLDALADAAFDRVDVFLRNL